MRKSYNKVQVNSNEFKTRLLTALKKLEFPPKVASIFCETMGDRLLDPQDPEGIAKEIYKAYQKGREKS